jgi:hypothetical protein
LYDLDHNTPLHLVGKAAWSKIFKPIDSAECLTRAGADLNAFNGIGETPLANSIVSQLKKQKPELFSKDL